MKIDLLPVEVLYLIDDYCEKSQRNQLKLACQRLYHSIGGKGLSRLHIGYSTFDSVLERYLGICICESGTCVGCKQRWLFLSPQKKELCEDVLNNPKSYTFLLNHVTSLSIKFGDDEWAQRILNAILPHCSNIEVVEISYIGDKFNRSVWREAINCFFFMPNFEKVTVNMYTTHCPRMFAEVLSKAIPNMKCFPLMIMDCDLPYLSHPWFIRPFKNLFNLEISINIEPYNFITAEDLGSFLMSLPKLHHLQLLGSGIFNPNGIQWIPDNLETLAIDSGHMDSPMVDMGASTRTKNGRYLQSLTIYTITLYEAGSLDLCCLEHLTSYHHSDAITRLLLSRLSRVKSIHITTDNFPFFVEAIERLSPSIQSVSIVTAAMDCDEALFGRFLRAFANSVKCFPALEFIYFDINSDNFVAELKEIFKESSQFPALEHLYYTSPNKSNATSRVPPLDPYGAPVRSGHSSFVSEVA